MVGQVGGNGRVVAGSWHTGGVSVTVPMSSPAPERAAAGRPGAGEKCVLLKLGEIVLKGQNRQRFEQRLNANIQRALHDIGTGVQVWQRHGVIVLLPRAAPDNAQGGPADGGRDSGALIDEIVQRVSDVPGIVRVCTAVRVPKDPDAAAAAAVELTAGFAGTFGVRARRRDKRFPMTSSQLASHIGTIVQQAHGLAVNLRRPDMEIFVEVDQREVFVFTGGLPGQGGLPVGMSGRGLVLMSGGIDSPVAAYRMLRRGLRCDFLHFSGMPLTGPESIYKAYALARELDRFQGGSRLFVVAFGKAQQQLASSGAQRLQIVAQRRLMLRTGEALAARLGAAALVTGDSLGQVSSQTLANITALDDSVALPILRPLIGWDKTEIMNEARRLRTLAISELPDQDCCTLLTPRRVETRANIGDLRRIERRLHADDLVAELVASVQEYRPAARPAQPMGISGAATSGPAAAPAPAG